MLLFGVAAASCSVAHPSGPRAQVDDTLNTPPSSTPSGHAVPGTQLTVPSAVEAGGILHGRAPPGSVVEAKGGDFTVGNSARFALKAPTMAGPWTIRIVRPHPFSPMLFRVQVVDGAVD